jgi:hypothetical protein
MKIERVKINDIKLNKKNPRTIRDEKFQKLVQSIKEFPEMMDVRPIVVDKDGIILGGNMRYKASKEAGLEFVSIVRAENLNEEQKKKFLIKDNVNYGKWDYLLLKDYDALNEWGMDIPSWATNLDNQNEEDDFFNQDFLNDYESSKRFEEEEEQETIQSVSSGTAFILLHLEQEDFNFIKTMEPKILEKTGTNNLSDAVGVLIKNN